MISALVMPTPAYDDTEAGMLEEIGATPESVLSLLTEAEEGRLTSHLDGARLTPDPVLKMVHLRSARLFCREAEHRARMEEIEQDARERSERFFSVVLPAVGILFLLFVVWIICLIARRL